MLACCCSSVRRERERQLIIHTLTLAHETDRHFCVCRAHTHKSLAVSIFVSFINKTQVLMKMEVSEEKEEDKEHFGQKKQTNK